MQSTMVNQCIKSVLELGASSYEIISESFFLSGVQLCSLAPVNGQDFPGLLNFPYTIPGHQYGEHLLPWWLSVGESACQCRRQVIGPGSGRIPHAMEQLSLCTTTICDCALEPVATTAEPMSSNHCSLRALEPGLHNKRGHCNEKPTHRNQRAADTATETQHSKNK